MVLSVLDMFLLLTLSQKYKIPCVVAGFQAEDIIDSITMLIDQLEKDQSTVEIQYRRAVSLFGNITAKKLLDVVFLPCNSNWRGLGEIPQSGLKLNFEYEKFNILNEYPDETDNIITKQEKCSCGDIMRGIISPNECALFATSCSPSHPVGPCMVSSEGACSAYYKYGDYYGK
jgi:hydrogenase expression/formation protein HypD